MDESLSVRRLARAVVTVSAHDFEHAIVIRCDQAGCVAVFHAPGKGVQLTRQAAVAAGWRVGVRLPDRPSCAARADYCPGCPVNRDV